MDKMFFNKAELSEKDGSTKDCTDFDCCGESLAFAMKDNYHEFFLGLSTVLHCLAIAEQEGVVPKLPDDWWLRVQDY